MKWHGMLFFFLLFTGAVPAARFALLIGNMEGGKNTEPLKYVENDLRSLQSTLHDYCSFPDEHIMQVYNEGPVQVYQALDRIYTMLDHDEENLLLLYYSGHADRENLKMGDKLLPIGKMKEKFSDFPATIRIGIFDACQSGSFTRLKGGTLVEPFLFENTGKISGEVILSASSATENAQESDLFGNSIFTFHFVNALRGSADESGDGKVTLSEAYQYTYNHTVSSTARTWGGVQHPGYRFRIQGEGDVVLADLTVRSTGLLLEGSIAGAVTITNENRNLVADLKKEPDTRVIIALTPGKYQVVVGGENGIYRNKLIDIVNNKLVSLHHEQLKTVETISVKSKGRQVVPHRLGVYAFGGYAVFNMRSTSSDLENVFNSYRMFNINPVFTSWIKEPFPGVGFSFRVSDDFRISLNLSRVRNMQEATYHGKMNFPSDSAAYNVNLYLSQQFVMSLMETGITYYPDYRLLNGVYGSVGIVFIYLEHVITSSFTDGLYGVTIDKRFAENGVLPVPFIGAGYRKYLGKHFGLLLGGRYRMQLKPETVSFSNTVYSDGQEPIRYRLNGFDAEFAVYYDMR